MIDTKEKQIRLYARQLKIRVYPKFCVNSKAGAKTKVDRGGGQGTLFAALAAMQQKFRSLSRAAAQPLFIFP